MEKQAYWSFPINKSKAYPWFKVKQTSFDKRCNNDCCFFIKIKSMNGDNILALDDVHDFDLSKRILFVHRPF